MKNIFLLIEMKITNRFLRQFFEVSSFWSFASVATLNIIQKVARGGKIGKSGRKHKNVV